MAKTYLQQFEAWFDDQKANHGLKDVKFYVGTARDIDSEDVAREFMASLDNSDSIDLTNERF